MEVPKSPTILSKIPQEFIFTPPCRQALSYWGGIPLCGRPKDYFTGAIISSFSVDNELLLKYLLKRIK